MAAEEKQRIIDSIKTEKYFSIIMDTTLDISHVEQLTIFIITVNMDDTNTSMINYYLIFIFY